MSAAKLLDTADPLARIAAFAADVESIVGVPVEVHIKPSTGRAEISISGQAGGVRNGVAFTALDHSEACRVSNRLRLGYEAATAAMSQAARERRLRQPVLAGPVYYPEGRRGE